MTEKSKGILLTIVLMTLFSIIACEPTIVQTPANASIPTWTPNVSNTPLPSKTPTIDFQAQAVFRATLWATENPLPTPPIGYPSPQPPLPDQAIPGEQYSYSNETLFFGNYVVRQWTNHFDPFNNRVITISTIGQTQAEVKHVYIDIGELSGVDITGDGKPELILYGSDGGNQCGGWVYIFSLGNELKEISNRIIRCRDYFKDLNNDGVYEYITTTTLPMSLSSLYRILQADTVWEYNPNIGYVNASSKYQPLYNEKILSTQSDIDTTINKGQKPDDYVYYLAMNYFYSGQDDKAWAVLKKYINPDKVKLAGQALIESRDYYQVQHPRP